MLSITVDGLQVDNQLPSALFPALLRPRPLPPARRLPNGSKAPVGIIQLDGLAPRPADRPPALHFFAKRRAADSPNTAGSASSGGAGGVAGGGAKRVSLTAANERAEGGESPAAGVEGSGEGGGGGEGASAGEVGTPWRGQGQQQQQQQELDMVVYYYDVATIWIRPVDLKVTTTRALISSMAWLPLSVSVGFCSHTERWL